MDDAARRPPASRLAGMSAPMVFALTFEHWLFQAMAEQLQRRRQEDPT